MLGRVEDAMVAATVGAKKPWGGGGTILTSSWGVVLFNSGGGGAAYGEDAHKDELATGIG